LVGVMLGITIITFIFVVLSTLRIIKIVKNYFSYPTNIHYCILLQLLGLLIYYSFYDSFWLRALMELFKLSTFMIVGFFFTLSSHKLGILPKFLNQNFIFIGFIFFFLIIVGITVLMIYWSYTVGPFSGCKNLARLLFATAQFIFALFFGIVSFLFLQMAHGIPGDKAISQNIIIRHTRPLTIVLVIYSFCAVSNLAFQILLFLFTENNEPCHTVLENMDLSSPWIEWLYPVIRQIDMIVPLWTILWYFYATTEKKEKFPPPRVEREPIRYSINSQTLNNTKYLRYSTDYTEESSDNITD